MKQILFSSAIILYVKSRHITLSRIIAYNIAFLYQLVSFYTTLPSILARLLDKKIILVVAQNLEGFYKYF